MKLIISMVNWLIPLSKLVTTRSPDRRACQGAKVRLAAGLQDHRSACSQNSMLEPIKQTLLSLESITRTEAAWKIETSFPPAWIRLSVPPGSGTGPWRYIKRTSAGTISPADNTHNIPRNQLAKA